MSWRLNRNVYQIPSGSDMRLKSYNARQMVSRWNMRVWNRKIIFYKSQFNREIQKSAKCRKLSSKMWTFFVGIESPHESLDSTLDSNTAKTWFCFWPYTRAILKLNKMQEVDKLVRCKSCQVRCGHFSNVAWALNYIMGLLIACLIEILKKHGFVFGLASEQKTLNKMQEADKIVRCGNFIFLPDCFI